MAKRAARAPTTWVVPSDPRATVPRRPTPGQRWQPENVQQLMASAGLALDRVHLDYLGKSKVRITAAEREQGGKVTWRVEGRVCPQPKPSRLVPALRPMAMAWGTIDGF